MLPNLHGEFRTLCLEILHSRIDNVDNVFLELKSKGIMSSLSHRYLLMFCFTYSYVQGSGNPIICRFRPILNSWDRFIFQKMLFYRSEKSAFWSIINVFSYTVS